MIERWQVLVAQREVEDKNVRMLWSCLRTGLSSNSSSAGAQHDDALLCLSPAPGEIEEAELLAGFCLGDDVLLTALLCLHAMENSLRARCVMFSTNCSCCGCFPGFVW